MIGAAIIAGGVFRRVLTLRALVLAAVAGTVAGLLAVGIPAPGLAADALTSIVAVFAALVVLPLVAGVPTSDRQGGLEQIVALRPVSSLSWTAGRVLGFLTGAGWLVVVMAAAARVVTGAASVPDELVGMRVSDDDAVVEYRFPLPSEVDGPFELSFDVLMVGGPSGEVRLNLRRGRSSRRIVEELRAQRRVVVPIPDLAPASGDLFITLRPSDGVLLAASPPRLVVGERPMALTRLPVARAGMLGLLVALLAVVAAASAFRFETACLAGLLAVSVHVDPPWAYPAWALGLVGFAWAGTALTRRQAMP